MNDFLKKTGLFLCLVVLLVFSGCHFNDFQTSAEDIQVSVNVGRAVTGVNIHLTVVNTADATDSHECTFTIENGVASGSVTGLTVGATYHLSMVIKNNDFIFATSSNDVTVKAGKNNVSMALERTTMEEIIAAFESAMTGEPTQLVLKSDVDWTQCASLGSMFGNPPEKPADFTLDLNGFTIYYNVPKEYDFRNPMIFFGNVGEGARFTVKNGKVNGKNVSESSFISARTDDEIGQVYNQYIFAEDLEIQGFDGSVFYMLGGRNQSTTYNNKLTIKNIKISGCGSSRAALYMVEHGTINATNVEITDCNRAVEIWDHDTVFDNVKITNCGKKTDDSENPVPAVMFGNGTAVLTGDTVIKPRTGGMALWVRPLSEGNESKASNVIMAGASIIDDSTTNGNSTVLIDGGNSTLVLTDYYKHAVDKENNEYIEYRGTKNVISRKATTGYAIVASVTLDGENNQFDKSAKAPGASQIGFAGDTSIAGSIYLEARENRKSLINKVGDWNGKIATVYPGSVPGQVFQLAKDSQDGLIGGAFTVVDVTYEEAVASFDLVEMSPKIEWVNWTASQSTDKYTQVL